MSKHLQAGHQNRHITSLKEFKASEAQIGALWGNGKDKAKTNKNHTMINDSFIIVSCIKYAQPAWAYKTA